MTPLPIAGTFTMDVKANGIKLYDIHLKVIEGQGQSLLGRDTDMKLNLLILGPEQSEINTFQNPSSSILDEFPELTKGFGKLKDFKLNLDIIEKVESPTDCLSPVVVIPKNNNYVRLCVDM